MRPAHLPKILIILLTQFLFLSTGYAAKFKWPKITKQEIALEHPIIDAEADVEYLYREYKMNDRNRHNQRFTRIYKKLKVFTESGTKDLAVIDFEFDGPTSRLTNFGARMRRSDGSIEELGRDKLYLRTTLDEYNDKKSKGSFSFSHLQPGAIVEYHWETKEDGIWWGFVRRLTEEWPTHAFKIIATPQLYKSSTLRVINSDIKYELTKDKVFIIEGGNLPAEVDEPFSPSKWDTSPWIYLGYGEFRESLKPERFWELTSKEMMRKQKDIIVPEHPEIKKLADSLFQSATSDEQKLEIAYNYCIHEIKNTGDALADLTSEEKKRFSNINSVPQVVKSGYGSGPQINDLFASLAANIGYEVRIAYGEDRHRRAFRPEVLFRRFVLPERFIAARSSPDSPWAFYDPGYDYMPYAYLDADCVRTKVLLASAEKAEMVITPLIGPEFSDIQRNATLALSSSGELTGKIEYRYFGYAAVEKRRYYDSLSDSEQREDSVKKLHAIWPQAKLENFSLDNLFDRDKPLTISYTATIPQFAESLNNRLFFEPNIFEAGEKPLFTKEKRHFDIVFRYAWEEHDHIEISLPEGYSLESLPEAKKTKAGSLSYHQATETNSDGNKLLLTRSFSCGVLGYSKNAYPTLKKMFEKFNEWDHVSTQAHKSPSSAQ